MTIVACFFVQIRNEKSEKPVNVLEHSLIIDEIRKKIKEVLETELDGWKVFIS